MGSNTSHSNWSPSLSSLETRHLQSIPFLDKVVSLALKCVATPLADVVMSQPIIAEWSRVLLSQLKLFPEASKLHQRVFAFQPGCSLAAIHQQFPGAALHLPAPSLPTSAHYGRSKKGFHSRVDDKLILFNAGSTILSFIFLSKSAFRWWHPFRLVFLQYRTQA